MSRRFLTSIVGLARRDRSRLPGCSSTRFGAWLWLDAVIVAIAGMVVTGAADERHEAAEITNLITHPLSYASRDHGVRAQQHNHSHRWSTRRSRRASLQWHRLVCRLLRDHIHSPALLNMILSIFEGIVQAARLRTSLSFSRSFTKVAGIKYRPFSYREGLY